MCPGEHCPGKFQRHVAWALQGDVAWGKAQPCRVGTRGDVAWGHRAWNWPRDCTGMSQGPLHGSIAPATPRGGKGTVPLPDCPLLAPAPPQLRVVPTPLTNVPDAVLLTCHVWGFYPPEVSIQWLHGGDVVASGDTAKLLPAGDWTYQTQVDLRTTAKTGDTYTCLVQHASLEQPLRESWSEPRGWGRGCGAPGSPVAQRTHSRPPCRSWIVPGDDGDGGGGRHRSGRGVGGPGRRRLRLLPPASGRG